LAKISPRQTIGSRGGNGHMRGANGAVCARPRR